MISGGATVETDFFRLGGEIPGKCKLYCTVTLIAGAATVTPGANATNVPGSGSLLRFLDYNFVNTTAQRAPQIVKTTSAGADLLTFTGSGTDVYVGSIEGYDTGNDVA